MKIKYWSPLVLATIAVTALKGLLPPWAFMWVLAIAIFAGFKWWTWVRAIDRGVPFRAARSVAYLFLWPGMNAQQFLTPVCDVERPRGTTWLWAFTKTIFGAVLIGGVARLAGNGLLAGWIGMVGSIFLLHFGIFAMLALFWQRCGVGVQPLMQCPVAAQSLGDFWGRRWNSGFRDIVFGLFFIPLAKRWGTIAATLFIFLFSGLVHDLVITFPASGGYGLPTLYFMIQGVAMLAERSAAGKRMGLAGGWRGRTFTLFVVAAPAFWLFPPPFVLNVMVPFFKIMGALT